MIKEAVVLAGGFGTRLKKVVQDVPKAMVDINGRPFLTYLLDELVEQQIKTVVLSVGYKYEMIREYFKEQYRSLSLKYAIEEKPLGTGGGIKKAFDFIAQPFYFIVNL